MIKRPKRNESEEEILQMQEEFIAQKAKNPKLEPAAKVVKVDKKSLFAQKRVQNQKQTTCQNTEERHENESRKDQSSLDNFVIGEIVERHFSAPKDINTATTSASVSSHKTDVDLTVKCKSGKSIFAIAMQAESKSEPITLQDTDMMESSDHKLPNKSNLNALYGSSSVIVQEAGVALDVHNQNISLLSQMDEAEILKERHKLLETLDPSLIKLLQSKRAKKSNDTSPADMSTSKTMEVVNFELSPSNSAMDLIKSSIAENWLHFDRVENHKLQWMQDIPAQVAKLQAGEQFEARFDWKGILLPHTFATNSSNETPSANESDVKDERELYLHGDEPHRPGYTLQELFRLARSNILQQRLSAFSAIGGILNVYNQGFYDKVLELPIAKIFFLLRFGLDDNTPAMLEVVTKGLAGLFYNETDETVLDLTCDNPSGYWQPTLELKQCQLVENDTTPIGQLQRQFKQLELNAFKESASIKADIDESANDSTRTMNDFQLAETDLLDCLLHTNILQRINYILHNIRPDNSTVLSCLKLLIRIARAGKDVAMKIINCENLMNCLLDNFLPGFEKISTVPETPMFYQYPQYLCLKLLRVLASQCLPIAMKLVKLNVIEKLQNYINIREDIRGDLIKVQIEAFRLLRCLLLLNVDLALHKLFLPAFRYMLEWHFHHVIFEVGGPFLIRQHAAALLAAITSGPGSVEAGALFGDVLYNCCCSWFHKATIVGVNEFSQTNLLSACLGGVGWYARYCDSSRFQNFVAKYLYNFIQSPGFETLLKNIPNTSIILHDSLDRRNIHPPLPGVGSILMQATGGSLQLIMPQTYAVHLLTAIWRLLEMRLDYSHKLLVDALIQPKIIEPMAQYLRQVGGRANRYLASNFYARTEVTLVCKLLCFQGFVEYFEKREMLQIVYNFLCCLTKEHAQEIEILLERVIFNKDYLALDEKILQKWHTILLELVQSCYIVVPCREITLTLPTDIVPILPNDWPYLQLRGMLQNVIENMQQGPIITFSEIEVLTMTFTLVDELDRQSAQLHIGTPTERLMYLMIAFMGAESQFLNADIEALLRRHILRFYQQWKDHTFQFEASYEGKCKFENLYALFVDHFQAASYGNELFGSLVLVPLAQKYDSKWRRRLWSDYAAALRFLHCDENLLIGGLMAYLEPAETDESLIRAYATALNSNVLRPNTIPYKIAEYHVAEYRKHLSK